MSKQINIGIVGFGRIGRNLLRLGYDDPRLNFVGISDLAEPEANEWMTWCFNNKMSHCNWAVNDKQEEWSILVPGASTTGGWSDDDLTDSGKLAKSIIVNWPE